MSLHPLIPTDPRRICIIKPSALGDIVQALPILPVLRRKFPQAEIAWVISQSFSGLLQGHPLLSEVIPFDRRGSLRSYFQLLGELRRRRFDLVFDLQGLLRTGIMTLATRAPVRLGLQTSREGSAWACHALIDGTDRNRPAHRRYQNLAAALGVDAELVESGVVIPREAQHWAVEKLKALPRPWLAVHAGAGWETKRWPAERFAKVASRFRGGVIAVGSPGEKSLAGQIAAGVRAKNGSVLDLCGETSLLQLAAVLEAADVVLSNDSGPMHLAAAVGTPVVGLFTCTNPVISGPAGSQHELLSAPVPCAGSYRKRCPQPGGCHLACFDAISISSVCAAIERVVGQRNAVPISA